MPHPPRDLRSCKQRAEEDQRPIADVLDEIITREPLEPQADLTAADLQLLFVDGDQRFAMSMQRREDKAKKLAEKRAAPPKADKMCSKCKLRKPIAEYICQGHHGGLQYERRWCEACYTLYYREYRGKAKKNGKVAK